MDELAPDEPRDIAGYPLLARLGEGGMGMVYLSHTRGGQPVALKVVRREYAQDPEFRRRFTQEVGAARRVQGVYTAPVLDSFTEGPEPWLAVSYVAGPSIAAAISEHGPLPVRTVLQLTAGIAEALQTIHAAGVIHRDLKPSNVLLAGDGPRVIDFGIARAADSTALTGSDVRLGTPAYMAPEQAMGGDVSPALDIFALGLVAYFAATRSHPFGDGNSHALLYRIVSSEPELSACPAELRELIGACLAKDPAARPTPTQLIDMCNALAGTGGVVRHEGWWLPPAVAQQIAEREQTVRLRMGGPGRPGSGAAVPPMPAQGPVPTRPGLGPDTAFAAGAPTRPEHTPGQVFAAGAPTAPAQGPLVAGHTAGDTAAGRTRRRTPLAAVLAVAGVLAVGGGGFAAYKLMGDDGGKGDKSAQGSTSGTGSEASGNSGEKEPGGGGASGGSGADANGPKTEAGWQVSTPDKTVVFRPPTFKPDSRAHPGVDACRPDTSSRLSLSGLTAEKDLNFLSTSGDYLTYYNCAEPVGPNGIRLADEGGTFGSLTKEHPTPSECQAAAESANLPNPIPPSKIRDDSVLKTGTGICVQSEDGTLTHLRVKRINKEPANNNLRTYVFAATQWKRES
ncbi:protein kinase domain-containing protein [Actinomycetota bacterium Odt1-20B]